MTRLRTIALLAGLLLVLPNARCAEQTGEAGWITIEPLNDQGWAEYNFSNRMAWATNGVRVWYGNAVLTAQEATVDQATGEVTADGSVRIQQGAQLWVSEHVRYNFITRQMDAQQFRTGQTPVFAAGEGLHADVTNHVYTATNASLTTDDVAQPAFKVRAKRIKIIPGQRIEARDAVLYAEGVPVFYFPYYSRNIGEHANNFNFVPGYRTAFGPFLLGSYTYYLNDEFDGRFHLDYRGKRGPGVGPDVNYNLGPWGEGTFKYYYTHDKDPDYDQLGTTNSENRQRVWFSYQSNPETNLFLKSMVQYQSDPAVVRDFFESEYGRDSQPNSFFDANKFWQNFSVDMNVQPRLNEFLQTVERLPDIRLTGYRQQIGDTPLYYETESSFGYYSFLYAQNAGTNNPPPTGLNYSAARADTYHQVVLPETFFGWLNVTPRVGGRFTYYSQATGPGAVTDEQCRGVFNTGAEVSFKASRVWPGIENDFLEVDGLRHIFEPSANYVYVPTPNVVGTNELPQFDSELPSLRLLPIMYPDYNSIDSINSQNVIRWGLHNKLQTKRDGQVVNLADWNLYTDWQIKPLPGQTTFSDLYSDLTLKPRSWITFESLLRYNINGGQFRMSYNTLTFQPTGIWSWSVGHYYLQTDPSTSPTSLGPGNNIVTSTFYCRFNENWGFRMGDYFNANIGRFQEQAYTVYRDLRSWTAALSFLVRNNTSSQNDFTVAFTFSLKAYPRYGVGGDSVAPYALLGH